jgi:hypothetical protein
MTSIVDEVQQLASGLDALPIASSIENAILSGGPPSAGLAPINPARQQIKASRARILRVRVTSDPGGESRKLCAQALVDFDQSLKQLMLACQKGDDDEAGAFLCAARSLRFQEVSSSRGESAARILGIGWPL